MAEVPEIITADDIKNIIKEGQNFLEGEDYASAVDHFAKALADLVPKYGEFHEYLGRVYLYYGQALLGFARDEAHVMVENMVPKEQNGATENLESVKEDQEEDEDEEEEEQEEEEDENKKNEKEENKQNKENLKTEEKNEKSEEKIDKGEKTEDKKEDEKTDDVEGEEGDDNVDNLQLAWENLEIARKIFQEEGAGGKDLLVETLYHLGDVAIESETFDLAIEDLQECLKLHEEIQGKTRRLADIHFKIALAYSMGNRFDESIENLNKASTLLKDRIAKLNAEKDKTEEIESEISEIDELLPEIENKITDVLAFKEEAHKSVLEFLKDGQKAIDGAETSASSTSAAANSKQKSPVKAKTDDSTKPVNDISHLVRKSKRTSDGETDVNPAKKLKDSTP